ncbi:MAG: CBS domain-containing protein [Candidatus Woesearchaeota archaeon]
MFDLKDIKRIRKSLGITQAELAKHAEVSQSLIAKIEAGRIEPSYTNVRKLFEALDSIGERSELKAADIMVKKIISCKPEESIPAVINKMRKFQISQVPVMNGLTVAGLISESTILERIGEQDVMKLRAKDVMGEAPPIVSYTTKHGVMSHLLRHFPIVLVARNGQIEGVITKSDLLVAASKA